MSSCSNISNFAKKAITITLTEKCNLACAYCYEHNKSCKSIDIELAKKIIKDELQQEDGTTEIHLDFFGGEPFCEFDKIKELVEFIKTIKFDKILYMYAATNGTLIHGEVQKWLYENKDIFSCSLSIDGTKEMHNVNRCNSFDLIDIDFFAKTYPNQPIKMTISQESLNNLCEGVVFLHKKGFIVHCNLAQGIDWSNKNNKNVLERELCKLIDFYIQNPDIQPCSILDSDISRVICSEESSIKHKWCGVGTHMRVYDVNGKIYPCHFFMPISVGEQKSKAAENFVFEDYISIDKLDKKCQTCKVESLCPTCYGANYETTGNIFKKDDEYCLLTKIIIKARSLFKALQWQNKQLVLTSEQEQALLRSILLIQKELAEI